MKQLNVKKAGSSEPALYPAGPVRHQPGGSLAAGDRGQMLPAKFLSLFSTLPVALGSFWPSLHPLDLAVGLCCGAGLRLAVYLKGKNAKKYRHNVEYGSAPVGAPMTILPLTSTRCSRTTSF